MREILFRGKQEEYPREWIEGMFTIRKFAGKEYHAIERRERRIITYDYEWTMQPYRVIPETIGQYTGKKDKNGKRIFEGDIVKFIGMVGQIVFKGGSFGIAFQKQIDWDKFENEIKLYTRCDNLACVCFNDNFVSLWEIYWNFNEEDNSLGLAEIIGNIHDNKLEDF